MNAESPLDRDKHDLEHPDGSRTLVWMRRGRIHLAVLGTAAALAAGAPAAGPPSGVEDQGQAPPAASAPAD
jgi:hypothetical protein